MKNCSNCRFVHAGRHNAEAEISMALPKLGDIELRILAEIQSRLLIGQDQYGKFQITEPRDLSREALEEVLDALVYSARRLA